jgi:flagellar hook-associated protein 2
LSNVNLFAQGGKATNGAVQFVSAGDRAVAGTYDVVITQAAAQAADTGLAGAWPPASLPTVKVRVGTTEVSYAVKSTDSRADVAAGLNSVFASNGLALQATDTGAGVKITTNAYGSAAKFDVDWDGSGYVSHTGVDVAGTIGGVTATGSGQQLIVPFSDTSGLSGLALIINSTSTGDLGNFTYEPGVAQRVQTAVSYASTRTRRCCARSGRSWRRRSRPSSHKTRS